MKVSFALTRALTAAALLGLIVLAVLGFLAQEKDLEGLRQSSQESIFWDASQTEAELARFVAALGRYAMGDESVTAADVNRRFDILWSRVGLFEQGDVGRRLAEYDADREVVGELRGLLEKYDRAVVDIARPVDTDLIREMMAEFTEAGEHLRALSLQVLHSEEARLSGVRDHVRASARLTWGVSMAALALALLLIGIMLIETRRYRRMAEESSESAARAEAASRAKSRFLTMMSHELRTPMNGVLGILALVRQSALSEPQQRLVERAERSGRQINTLLEDILDFSDLQSERLAIAADMFQLQSLAASIEETFGQAVRREGVAFRIEVDPEAPRWVVGDLPRLRQAIGHFVRFFVEEVRSRDVCLTMSRAERGIEVLIDASVPEGNLPGWQPEAMFDRGDQERGDFASDALGPMIGRGLVTSMGGSLDLRRAASGRSVLSVGIPLKIVERRSEHVRIEADSVTVHAVLGALLRQLGCELWEPGRSRQKVTTVLMEAGFPDEMARAARLRSEHPAAVLVAIGEPSSPKIFDAVCPQPVTAKTLSAQIGIGRGAAREVV